LQEQSPRTISFRDSKEYTLDEYGFLYPPEQWDEVFAEGMARRLGIVDGLTPEHWEFIRYLRRKFLEEKTIPLVVYACADNNLRLSRLAFLFPTGYHRGACKIAGINYQFMFDSNPWLTYESYSVLKSEFKLTSLGFLESFDQWNERFAKILASEGQRPLELSEVHWRVIHFLRDFYHKTNTVPTVFATCKANHIELSELLDLFPSGYRRGACRMAGLPFFA
jgi:tRNA 2-thiouridine synthesizing protein E